MSTKLAKVAKKWGGKKIAKAAKKTAEREADIGKTAHKALQFIGGVGVGTITKHFGRLPFVKAAPDEIALGLGLLGKFLFKGAKGKFSDDLMWAGANALGGRMVWTGQLFVISDGKTVKVDQGAPKHDDGGVKVNAKVKDGRVEEINVDTRAA